MKNLLHFLLTALILNAAQAQTHYGTSAGTLGVAHSYFGSFAGNAALNTSYENSFIGTSSGRVTTTGFGNTAVGFNSLRSNVGGYWNTAIGTAAMFQNTSGYRNTATGRMALYSNTEGNYNVATGYNALLLNTAGYNNTATGSRSMYENTTGNYNTAAGSEALYSNSTGSNNTATGALALYSNLTGTGNIATGVGSLYYNTTGTSNTATGNSALSKNTTGSYNTATGALTMNTTTTGSLNSAFGAYALVSAAGSNNSAFGAYSLNSDLQFGCTGSFNSAFGAQAGPPVFGACDVSNTTALGALSVVTASNQVRIGNSSVTSIGGQVSWTTLSDGRFKREIRQDVAGLDFINQLNPVSYVFDKKAINSFLRIPDSVQVENESARKTPTRQIGFVAQEVEAVVKKSGYVFSGVEVPENENDPYTIRYAEFVVPLVKAVQELTAKTDEQEKRISKLTEVLRQYAPDISLDDVGSSGPALFQNNPNPFSTTTEIQMKLPDQTRNASIIVYNLEGKQLKDIQVMERGTATVNIAGNELSPGMYLYTLIADGRVVDTKRLILTK